jgi:hypothetical protein
VTSASGKNRRPSIDSIQEIEIQDNWKNRNIDEFSFLDMLSGLIPRTLYDSILFITTSQKETTQIFEKTMEKFKKFLKKMFWVPRCKFIKAWELNNEIKRVRIPSIGLPLRSDKKRLSS